MGSLVLTWLRRLTLPDPLARRPLLLILVLHLLFCLALLLTLAGVLQPVLPWAALSACLLLAALGLVLASQQTLRRAEHLLFYDNPVPMWVFDTDTLRFLDVNHAMTMRYGWSRDELLSMTVLEIRPAAERERLLAELATAPQAQTQWGVHRHMTRAGEELLMDISTRFTVYRGRPAMVVAARDVTREAEAARLRDKALADASQILESISEGFFAVDRDWTLRYINEPAQRMLQRKQHELLGKNIWDEFPEAVGGEFHREYQRVLDEQTPGRVEGFYAPLNVWFEAHTFPSEDGVVVYFQDITERKQAADRNRLLVERFELASRATQDAIWDWDPASDVIWASERYTEQFGYSSPADGHRFAEWESHIHPEDRERVLSGLRESLEGTGDKWQVSYRQFKHNGELAEVQDVAYIMRDRQGRAIRMVGAVRDITAERRSLSEKLLLSSALEAAKDGVVIADAQAPDQPITFVNQAFVQLTGYTREEVLGRNCRFLQQSDRNQPGLELLRQKIAAGEPASVLLKNYRKDGSLFWNELSLSPIRDGAGRITHFVGVQHDATDRKRQELALYTSRRTHQLTGLPNAAVLHEWLTEILGNAARRQQPVAMLMCDVDDLSAISTEYGRETGDAVVRFVAQTLSRCAGKLDLVAHVSGDEFVLVIHDGGSIEAAEQAAKRFLKRLSAPGARWPEGLHVSATVGISQYPQHGETADRLIANAEAAMHAAKSTARGHFAVYRDAQDGGITHGERRQLLMELRQALDREQLTVHFQPQVHLWTGQVSGFEALVRWTRQNGMSVPPSLFVQIAEESGLVDALGKLVSLRALQELQRLSREQGFRGSMAINVSPVQLSHEDFVPWLGARLSELEIDPGRLEIEITESTVLGKDPVTLDQLKRITSMGVGISVDDFGTGYASLSYLTRFTVNKLKIDRSFVRDLGSDQGARAIVEAVMSMGHNLGAVLVAEGVETFAQAQMLRDMGCDMMQGFLVSPGLPTEGLEALLARQPFRLE